jgi:methionyl-tRNA formyltransferase
VNRVRGLMPWPGCYGILRGQRFHIWKGKQAEGSSHVADGSFHPGQLHVIGRRLFAACQGGAIELLEVQLEGKKRMTAAAFLNGFAVSEGEALA